MKTDGHEIDFVAYDFVFDGMLIIIYFGKPIAAIHEDGTLVMRNEDYPLGLIEYLIENMSMHNFWLN